MSSCLIRVRVISPDQLFKLATGLLLLLILNACATQMKELKDFTEAHTPESIKQISAELTELDKEISQQEEIKIGEQMISGVFGAAPLVENVTLQQYVNDVGSWVAFQSSRKDLPWHFGVIDSTGINAFAAPGGYIVITSGLFNLIENEAQLAGVLAHEIGHVVGKHHLIALKQSMKQEYWAGLGLKLVGDPEVLKNLVDTALQLYISGLDRKYEFGADSRAVVLAARAGYDPYALLNVLSTIDNINPSEASLAVLLKTHPPIQQRIEDLSEIMQSRANQFSGGRVNLKRFETVKAGLKP